MNLPVVQSFPDHLKSKVPAKFLWVDQSGQKWPPELMQTRHLFYSLRMIWNHRMPEEAKIRPYKQYDLRRSDEYLKEAVLTLSKELATRQDMDAVWKEELSHMMSWLSTHQLEAL